MKFDRGTNALAKLNEVYLHLRTKILKYAVSWFQLIGEIFHIEMSLFYGIK